MDDNYASIRGVFEELKAGFPALQSRLEDVTAKIQARELADEGTVSELQALLCDYQRLVANLRSAGDQLSISIAPGIEDIEAQILSLEAQQSALQLLKIIHTYFRLKAESDDLAQSLEETKQALMVKCANAGEGFDQELLPYSVVVAKAQEPGRPLSEDEFNLIYEGISRRIALAAERGKLTVDADADISAYLDGSNDWLVPEEYVGKEIKTVSPEEFAEMIAQMDSPAEQESEASVEITEAVQLRMEDITVDEETEHEPMSEMSTEPQPESVTISEVVEPELVSDDNVTEEAVEEEDMEEASESDGMSESGDLDGFDDFDDLDDLDMLPLWEKLDGYLDGEAKYTITEDTPSGSLSSKVFEKHLNKTHGFILPAIHAVANEKVCSDEEISDPEHDFNTIPNATIDFLFRQGYLRKIQLINGQTQKDYWALSSKGWACFTKKEVAEQFRNAKLPFDLKLKSSADEWSVLMMARYGDLYQYMVAARQVYVASKYIDVIYGIIMGEPDTIYLPGLFARGNEDFQDICTLMWVNDDAEKFVIIVRSRSDAEKIAPFLEAINQARTEGPALPLDKVQYVLIDQPGMFFDPDGSEETNHEENDSEEEHVEEAMDQAQEITTAPESTHSVEPTEIQQETAIPVSSTLVHESEDTEVMVSPEKKTASEDPAIIQQYLNGAWRMQIAGRTDVASVMIKSLVERDPELQMLADQFAYATGDPSLDGSHNSNALQAVFSMPVGTKFFKDTLTAAAYLRMYFSFAASEQTYLSRDMSHQRDNEALKKYPDLKEILFNLADWVKYQQRGLDADIIEQLLKNRNTGVKQRDLQKKAQELLNSRLTESSHGDKRIKRNRVILFGNGSDIYNILTGIMNNDQAVRPLAETFVLRDVDVIIDDAWNEATRQLRFARNENCTGAERTTLTRQIRGILSLVKDWIAVNTGESHVDNEQTKVAEKLIEQLKPMMTAVLQQLCNTEESISLEEQAAESILAKSVRDCLDRITGASTEEGQAYDYYINLLKEPYIALDDINQPHVEKPDEEVEPYDFCRRAMMYLDAPERTWEEVLNRIFTVTGTGRSGMDYGCAGVLKMYLALTGMEDLWKTEYDIENAVAEATDKASVKRNSVALWEQDFTARLEMADGDNWFDADQSFRSHIQKVIAKQKESYYYSENFGFYGRAMNRLYELLRGKAQSLRPRYRDEYVKLIDGRSEEELELPIFAQIHEMIEKDRFGAAESFMQQVRNGNLTIGNGELSSGTLDDFLNRVNSELYRLAKLDTNKTLALVYQGMHRRILNATQRSGETFVKAWPNSGMIQGDKVKAIFSELDQQVSSVTGQGTDYVVHFQDRGIVMDYPHPIAAFGSIMDQNGIDVAILSGNRGAEGLYTEIDKILRRNHNTDRPLLLLVDSAITVADRRKLAKSISRITSNKPFLLIDRCLALYLADTPKTDRWKTLIRCSLPFRVINPYFENSAMPIPPDMFIGRREEIQKIIAPDGPNLLYGGRQLGKTAILRRVEFQQNRPSDGNWASYVDIRGMNHVDAVDTIAKALRRNKFFTSEVKPDTWRALINSIESQLMDNEANKRHTLLLMLDEADNILKLFEEEDFQALGDMKRLQQTTNGRFKFVLAGLHNVLRFSNKALGGNSVLPHLGGITIQPMKFSDGRELLEVPLSYLGFTIDPGQEDIIAQILYNTNYFPGLIHFYASRLVEHMKEISSEVTTPPYKLSRDVLLRMIGDESFRQQRTEKLMMTLKVDEKDQDAYYYTLAYALAMCCYESEETLLHGASAAQIREVCIREYANCRIGKLTDQQVEVLLDELVTLNILRPEERDGVRFYMFSRSSFLEMLGSEDDVIMNLLDTLDKEAKKQ